MTSTRKWPGDYCLERKRRAKLVVGEGRYDVLLTMAADQGSRVNALSSAGAALEV